MKLAVEQIFHQNILRVRELTQLHLALASFPGTNRALYGDDVLRASLVLLHAALEELIRGVLRIRLPGRESEQLNKVPLLGFNTRNQPKAFLFGHLKPYKDMKIQDLIEKSIDEYLNYTNYNRVEDIIEFLQDVGLEKTEFEDLFSSLKTALERRHIIVHRADRRRFSADGASELEPISSAQVEISLDTVVNFGERLLSMI